MCWWQQGLGIGCEAPQVNLISRVTNYWFILLKVARYCSSQIFILWREAWVQL